MIFSAGRAILEEMKFRRRPGSDPGSFCVIREGCKSVARPLKYKTVAELEAAIDQYFADCEGELLRNEDGTVLTDKHGNPIVLGAKPPTVTGLALALGFTGRKQLLDYQGRKAFCNTITRAKSRCEEYAESRLYDRDGSRGAAFSLEYNFRWKDQQNGTQVPDDGFLDALKADAEDVWQD